jgi:putative NADPH-quinone reductase
MIINFHPKEKPSKKGLEVIKTLKADSEIFHSTDKSTPEWQEIIKSNEKLVLVAPTYWWGPSYEFDKWLQEVFAYNFAYSFDTGSKVGLLDGREFEFHLTHGTPDEFAQTMKDNIIQRLKLGIFEYSNAKVEVNFHFAN